MKLRHTFMIVLVISIVMSCETEHKERPVGESVIDTAVLGEVSAGLIHLAIKQKGLAQFNSYFRYSISVNKISYTTTYRGEEIKASGLICYPKNAEGPLPILLVQNGLAYSDIHAPTAFAFPDNFLGYEFLASAGYIIVLPDMIGFGEADEYIFPIYHAGYTISTVKDMLTAANEYFNIKGLNISDYLFMGGYSMGAYISAVMQKSFESDPDFNYTIVANAIGAGGYDLLTLMNISLENDRFATPSHLALIFSSYNDSYEWDKELTTYFTEEYAKIIPEVISGKYTREQADSLLTPKLDDLLNPDFLNDLRTSKSANILNALEENSIHNWNPVAPIRLYHSKSDERIPFSDSQQAYNNMIGNGSISAKLVEIEGDDHFNAVFNFMEAVMPWFDSLKVR